MTQYRCEITWDVVATSPREAAEIMWCYITESDGPIIEVRHGDNRVQVDLLKEDERCITDLPLSTALES